MDVLAFVANFEDLRLVARAFTFVADEFHVGQELHFDGDSAISLAILTAPAGDVEGKMSGCKTALLCFRKRGKHVTDYIEGFDVGDRIRPGRASDGRLID